MLNIFTFADKRPDFIEWQALTLKHFCKDEYRLFVFNNAKHTVESFEIINQCAKHGAICIDIPQQGTDHSNPNAACAAPLNWAWKNIICKHFGNEPCLILDSDMFPVRAFTCTAISGTANISSWYGCLLRGVKQRRAHVKYIWNGLLFFTKPCSENRALFNYSAMDFNYGEVDGVLTDVGGFTHHFFEQYPYQRAAMVNIRHTSHIHSKNNNLFVLPVDLLKDYDENFCMELYEYTFLHYGRGSNWDNQSEGYHHSKTEFLKKALAGAMDGSIKFERYDYVFSEDEWK